ncbi:MAG: hypothetical protein O8C63_10820, partial [Candidatus Methanoperedens sp.]|nr:hypothetical protein [Candidatus Methanoperedens sp.]
VQNLIIVLAINGWMVYARITRGIMLSLRELPYIDAARVIGCRMPIYSSFTARNLTSKLRLLSSKT